MQSFVDFKHHLSVVWPQNGAKLQKMAPAHQSCLHSDNVEYALVLEWLQLGY